MIIELRHKLLISFHKTIDGHGMNVQIKNDVCEQCHHPWNSHQENCAQRWQHDQELLQPLWIDHVYLFNSADGFIDVIMSPTTITISNCHMTKHNNVILFGARY
ncbi:hypothetical protein CR513_28111, partial [Mucuna pruriens]